MDVKLDNEQIKQLSIALSINDVLDCIKKNYDSYLKFLEEELKNNNISLAEYNNELTTLDKIKELKVWWK